MWGAAFILAYPSSVVKPMLPENPVMQPFVLACRRALEHSFVHFAEMALFDVKKSAQMDGLQKKRRKFSNTH